MPAPGDKGSLRNWPWLGPPLAALHDRRTPPERIVVFYDAECGICSRLIRFLLAVGVPANLYFASQQGASWQALVDVLPRFREMDSVVVVVERGARRSVRAESEAVLWLLTQLRFPWCLAWPALWLPQCFCNPFYRLIARNRRRLGAALPGNACLLAPVEFRERFLD